MLHSEFSISNCSKFCSRTVGFSTACGTAASLWDSFLSQFCHVGFPKMLQNKCCTLNSLSRAPNSVREPLVCRRYVVLLRRFETPFWANFVMSVSQKCCRINVALEILYLELLQILFKSRWFVDGMWYCCVALRLLFEPNSSCRFPKNVAE